jgi:hypothetical protein
MHSWWLAICEHVIATPPYIWGIDRRSDSRRRLKLHPLKDFTAEFPHLFFDRRVVVPISQSQSDSFPLVNETVLVLLKLIPDEKLIANPTGALAESPVVVRYRLPDPFAADLQLTEL